MMRALDMRARKSLGQNFLFDLNLTRRIARSAGNLNGTTIEVGPGPGGLTRALLLEGAEQVIAIEKDFRARSVLDSLLTAADGRLQLLEDDALKTPLWEVGDAPRRIIANLPYNIATSLLIQWLEHAPAFESLTLMFQREVAERITAAPGDSAYGRLSIPDRLVCGCTDPVRYPARSICSGAKDHLFGRADPSAAGTAFCLQPVGSRKP